MNVNTYLSAEASDIFSKALIGIAGAGGLGSNCAMHLVRAGISRFIIADIDTVNQSNLNRQFFFADQIGEYKTTALAENLMRINPDLELELHTERVTAENAFRLFGKCSIVVEAFDSVESKEMLFRTLLPHGKIMVGASGLAGFGHSNQMRIRNIAKTLYLAGDMKTGISPEKPPVSPRVGIAAAMQANTVAAILLGEKI